MLALTDSDILTFEIVDFQKVGQSHGVQFCNNTLQWQMLKSIKDPHIFILVLTASETLPL